MSLATFCQQEGGVTCDTTSYPNVHHDRLAASEWVRRNGLSFLASGDNLRHRFAQRIAELCYIKCTCEPDAALDANTPPGPPPVIETGRVASDSMLSEWNFDSQTGLIRQQLPEEKFWTKTGYMGKEMVYLNHYSRGSEANRPTCYANDLDHGLVLYLHARTGIYYSSPASLCLHRYYEGHENASLGGVCLLNENGKRFLAFDHVNRAPIYSIDNFDPQSTLADRTIPQAVSVYCKNYCWCDSDKETEAAAKKEVATGQLSFVDIFEPHPDPTTQAYDETLAELAREVDMKASEQPSGSFWSQYYYLSTIC
ncbi:MAG: hypothetical protein M1814_002933 [Vezdaea aestivalis]|nr:MAG: hypothetical protein M1814_002933 [Vezdaea aestivalis]